ncbi:hypothetical protein M153_263000412, partial [Pseudoloma neurophilia]
MINFANIRIVCSEELKIIVKNLLGFKTKIYIQEFQFFCILGVNELIFDNFRISIEKYGEFFILKCTECNLISQMFKCICENSNKITILVEVKQTKNTLPFHLGYKIENKLSKFRVKNSNTKFRVKNSNTKFRVKNSN